jgi:hypothetical protein
VAAVLSSVAAFPAASSASAQSVAGEWTAAMNTPGGVREFGIVFQVHGDSLSGTVKRAAGDVPLSGKVTGETVTFRYVINYGGSDLPLTVTAVVDGDTMRGVIDFNGVAEDEFWAKRAAPAPASAASAASP